MTDIPWRSVRDDPPPEGALCVYQHTTAMWVGPYPSPRQEDFTEREWATVTYLAIDPPWVPVSERLPKVYAGYLVAMRGDPDFVIEAIYYPETESWSASGYNNPILPIHWREKPAPPRRESEFTHTLTEEDRETCKKDPYAVLHASKVSDPKVFPDIDVERLNRDMPLPADAETIDAADLTDEGEALKAPPDETRYPHAPNGAMVVQEIRYGVRALVPAWREFLKLRNRVSKKVATDHGILYQLWERVDDLQRTVESLEKTIEEELTSYKEQELTSYKDHLDLKERVRKLEHPL